MARPTAADLIQRYGAEGEHPMLPRAAWRADRDETDHRLSYWDWVEKEIYLVGDEAALESPE